MGSRINTIMQTCFFAISGVLPRDEAIAQIKDAIAEDLRQAGRGRRRSELRGRRSHALAHLHAGEGARHGRPPCAAPAASGAGRGAGLRAARHGRDAGQPGRPAAGQRIPGRWHLADRHGAVGEAQPRRGDPGVGRGALHPVQQVRDGLPARGDSRQGLSRPTRLAGAPADVQVASPTRAPELRGHALHDSGRARRLHRLHAVRDGLPGEGQVQSEHKALDMQPQRPLRDAERENYEFFLDLPEVDRARCQAATSRARSSCSRSSSTRAPAPAAARRRTSSC